ncbi:hypothetical protein WISP_87670 [Willisornis vidua]|uniref:Uncharacterized protein n=1 Tax=Willisornis vidua TaxID=1566151 RepID=A0ABQ9D795_9PASS|nr:hypothetical protein WISP_87670 [Willisornis vidua]
MSDIQLRQSVAGSSPQWQGSYQNFDVVRLPLLACNPACLLERYPEWAEREQTILANHNFETIEKSEFEAAEKKPKI